ncbi:MAG: hypothetical protein F9K30_16115 [Dechloromonas sp.]|nr:MAG: hypothetical protein F9K30_16115 [Dechloromonas sp.]
MFPGNVELEFRLEPGGAFGENVPPRRTVPLGAKARFSWNACRGETIIQTDARLSPLDFHLDMMDGSIHIDGPVLRLHAHVVSRQDLERLIQSYFYALPPLLGLEMLDSCIFSEVLGRLGNVSFCWGLQRSGMESVDVTTSDIQEDRFRRALSRLRVLDERNGLVNRRLLAATQYFHIACRLAHTPSRRWEFLAETLLNYAKVLESLFPPSADGTISAARVGLRSLGFDAVSIEALYIPALALRNAVDVAHPTLAAFNDNQLAILEKYTDVAESAFRDLLGRIFNRIAEGRFSLTVPSDTKPSAATLKVLARIEEALAVSDGEKQSNIK